MCIVNARENDSIAEADFSDKNVRKQEKEGLYLE